MYSLIFNYLLIPVIGLILSSIVFAVQKINFDTLIIALEMSCLRENNQDHIL